MEIFGEKGIGKFLKVLLQKFTKHCEILAEI